MLLREIPEPSEAKVPLPGASILPRTLLHPVPTEYAGLRLVCVFVAPTPELPSSTPVRKRLEKVVKDLEKGTRPRWFYEGVLSNLCKTHDFCLNCSRVLKRQKILNLFHEVHLTLITRGSWSAQGRRILGHM